jgi:Flp pilus assembly pilin Flp
MHALLHKLWADDNGQDIAEYALMLTTVLLIVAATVSAIGNNSNAVFSAVAGKLTSTQ